MAKAGGRPGSDHESRGGAAGSGPPGPRSPLSGIAASGMHQFGEEGRRGEGKPRGLATRPTSHSWGTPEPGETAPLPALDEQPSGALAASCPQLQGLQGTERTEPKFAAGPDGQGVSYASLCCFSFLVTRSDFLEKGMMRGASETKLSCRWFLFLLRRLYQGSGGEGSRF